MVMLGRYNLDPRTEALYEHWVETLKQSCGNYETILPEKRSFEGRIDMLSGGGLAISRIRTNARKISKRRAERENGSANNYFIVLQHKGQGRFQQSGNDVVLNEGDITIMDQRYPCQFQYKKEVEHLSFGVPVELMHTIMGRSIPDMAVKIDTKLGFAAILRRYLLNSYGAMSAENELEIDVSAETLIKVLAESLGLEKTYLSNKEQQKIRLNEVKVFVQKNLGDQSLTVEGIADVNNMSRRQLFRLFQQANTTPYKWLKQRRLMMARELLVSPEFQQVPVIEIAIHCGFSDLAYFTRAFTESFQQPPACYRASLLQAR